MLRSFFSAFAYFACALLAMLAACTPTDTDNPEDIFSENGEFAEMVPSNVMDNTADPDLDEADLALIEQAYGKMSEEEWQDLLAELGQFSDDELSEWLTYLEDYVAESQTEKLASCSGYYGSRIGFGWFPYSTASAYRNLWTTNCYFKNAAQCGGDYVVSFWMGPDYRGNQSKLVAYSSSSTARWWLTYVEGGYSGEIRQSGSYYNFYACWPWELYPYKDSAQLKQLY